VALGGDGRSLISEGIVLMWFDDVKLNLEQFEINEYWYDV
jgi:hypothetical protein